MALPHPALLDLAAGRPLPPVHDHHDVVVSAADHGMGGLLWSELRTTSSAQWPSCTELVELDLITRQRHRELWTLLDWLTATIGGLGIDVASLKGVTSEARWYDRVGERPCIDVDVLLAPHDVGRVRDVIAAIDPGHRLIDDAPRLIADGRIQSVELQAHGLPVDLHLDPWKIGVPSRAADEVWATTTELALAGGGTVRVLGPEAALIQFVVHLTKDRFRRLLGHVDVARVIQRGEIDWTLVDRLARLDGLHDQISLGLHAVGAVATIEHSLPRAFGGRAAVWRVLWRPAIRLQGGAAVHRYRWRQHLIPVLARGRAVAGLRNLTRRLLPDAALVRYRHPDRTGPYLWRLLVGRSHGTRRRRQARQLADR